MSDASDRECLETAIAAFVDAVNTADEPRLSALLGASAFTLAGQNASGPADAAAMLATRGRARERWTLLALQFSGRGYDGNVHFGLRMRRAGPDLPMPYVDQGGKGSLECPSGRFVILSIA